MTLLGNLKKSFKSYSLALRILLGILLGTAIGCLLQEKSRALKPLGDIFLNLLFTSVVPLVFFSISSAVAGMSDLGKLRKILGWMIIIFILTGILSACLMIVAVKLFPPVSGPLPNLSMPPVEAPGSMLAQIVSAFTVPDFLGVLTKKNMLALIVFALIVGWGTSTAREKGKGFSDWLLAGNEVMIRVIGIIMGYAPIGLGAYFAYLVGVFGPELMGSYLRAVGLYYPLSIAYFFIGYTFYAWLAGGKEGVRQFWSKILLPAFTALGTGSSVATIPSNLQAADEIGVPKEISRLVIPIGATIHMDGTCISAILKISLLFSFFQIPFSGFETYAGAVGVALLSGMVMSGIPGGGFLGELLIVNLYGFPPEALPMISMVGTLVDPPATMVNATGDNVVSMMVTRIFNGKNWLPKPVQTKE